MERLDKYLAASDHVCPSFVGAGVLGETQQHFPSRSQLTHRTYGIVLAGGRGSRLHQLTDWRAKPAVPFAGKLKIVDFALSNRPSDDRR